MIADDSLLILLYDLSGPLWTCHGRAKLLRIALRIVDIIAQPVTIFRQLGAQSGTLHGLRFHTATAQGLEPSSPQLSQG